METQQMDLMMQKLNELKNEVRMHKIETKKGFDQIESILNQIEDQIMSKRTEDTPKVIRKRSRVVFPEVGMSNRTKRVMEDNEKIIGN